MNPKNGDKTANRISEPEYEETSVCKKEERSRVNRENPGNMDSKAAGSTSEILLCMLPSFGVNIGRQWKRAWVFYNGPKS
jgi:hypothetical protein